MKGGRETEMSEKQPPKTGIDLYQIALLIDQLKHDDVQIRANASRSLTVIGMSTNLASISKTSITNIRILCIATTVYQRKHWGQNGPEKS